jgi:hypothetical protein
MAWSGNLRCLHCDGKLPLYRKLTSGQFCSKAHSDLYWQEQQRLAVERLHQTHDSLRAYRAPDSLETILGKPAASEPVSSAHYYSADDAAAAEHFEPELEVSDRARSASNTGDVTFAGFVVEDQPGLRAWDAIRAAWDGQFALWPMSRPATPGSVAAAQEYALGAASAIPMPRFLANGFAAVIRTDAEPSGPAAFAAQPVTQLPHVFLPEPLELSELLPEVVPEVEETLPPFAESLMALGKFGSQGAPPSNSPAFTAHALEPIETAPRAQNTHYDATFDTPAVAAATRLEPLALTNAPRALAARASGAGAPSSQAIESYTAAPSKTLVIPAAAPAMRVASGSRYPIFAGVDASAKAKVEAFESTEAMALRSATASPLTQLESQSVELSLNTAPGCRYGVASQPGTTHALGSAAEIQTVPAPRTQMVGPTMDVDLRTASACALSLASQPGIIGPPLEKLESLAAKTELQMISLPDRLGRGHLGCGEWTPAVAKRVPLAFRASAIAPPAPLPVTTGVELLYAANVPMNPRTKFEPAEGLAAPPRHGFVAWTQSLTNADERKQLWAHGAEFWQKAPRNLKVLAVAIPILLGLALRPSLPKVPVAAPSSTHGISREISQDTSKGISKDISKNISKNIGDGFREQFINVRNSVAQRAGVSLSEDFRAGLEDWAARGDMSSGWSFDGNGFVRPGTLALYKPSMALTDYDMDFLGLVDKKALSWVVRAKDFDNYYVVKLVMLKSGPLPVLGITRYAVIDGKAEARVDTKVAIDTRPDMLYRITMNLHDDTFLLSLQGSVVDNWTDSRLKSGGVGFFAPKGEESRLRWLQLTHQYDMLGRLCAYLAPYNIPTTNGSW